MVVQMGPQETTKEQYALAVNELLHAAEALRRCPHSQRQAAMAELYRSDDVGTYPYPQQARTLTLTLTLTRTLTLTLALTLTLTLP